MKTTKKINQATDEVAKIGKPAVDPEVEVLYQKLGDEWYAFSIIDEEVFFGKVDINGSEAALPKKDQ